MRNPTRDNNQCCGAGRRTSIRRTPPALAATLLPALLLASVPAWAAQAKPPQPPPQLPEAPQPQTPQPRSAEVISPCKATPDTKAATAGAHSDAQPCPSQSSTRWLTRFLNGPEAKRLTPKEKAQLAVLNLIDPFNAATILVNSGITIGADAHTAYGPGMAGFGRHVGVSYTQEMTGEFFGTFLIPSIVHQDPRYYRMPKASFPRRFGHAITEVIWTRGDNGKGMLNYGNLVGFAIGGEIGNLYVPGRETDAGATAARYGIGLATAPIDNFITEFLPDVARHIHVRVVLVQRIIDQVAKSEGGTTP